MRDTGWYCCSNGDLQMPVHITVNQQTTTQITTTESTSASTTIITTVNPLTTNPTDTFIKKQNTQDNSPTSVTIGYCTVYSSISQASVNHTVYGALGWEQIFFYLPKTVNAIVFILCTIVAVVKFWAN
ncbi:hypothetical protein UPYG_G00326500 [Umbra pygmaea]|uniref:Uncharacterized protein n=1 Tax=Umbra pygmaea TaxID=75934 RepID=A0ABD0WK56_UMBPY